VIFIPLSSFRPAQRTSRAHQKVLEVAEANGWQRQIQVNQDVKKSLENIINTLEEKKDE